jgi:hypothetical protein
MEHKLKLGCDPEVFISDLNGVIIPACGKIGGSKQEPKPVGPGYWVQEDNVLLEYNITPVPHEMGSDALASAANAALDYINRKVLAPKKLTYVGHSAYEFDKAVLDQYPEAKEFGCEPDFNAHLFGEQNPRPDPAKAGGLRTAGGHIHAGYDVDKCPIPRYALVQLGEALALYPGFVLASTEIVGKQRIKLYGSAGAFREKPYGFEYRTPSNQWLFGASYVPSMLGDVWLWAITNPDQASSVYDQINYLAVQESINKLRPDKALARYLADLYHKNVNTNGFAADARRAPPRVARPQVRMRMGDIPNAEQQQAERAAPNNEWMAAPNVDALQRVEVLQQNMQQQLDAQILAHPVGAFEERLRWNFANIAPDVGHNPQAPGER